MMIEKINKYVEQLFAGYHKDPQALEVKEELLSNLSDKYEDHIASGRNEEEAYQLVINSIGDIKALLGTPLEDDNYYEKDIKNNKDLRSIYQSIGASLFVLSIAVVFLFEYMNAYMIGLSMMFILWAVATGCIVYGNSKGTQKYVKKNDTFVENYKEKISNNDRNKRMKSSLSSIIWPLTLVAYLGISFITQAWYITWLIFFIGLLIQLFIINYYSYKGKALLFASMVFTVSFILYFIISFAFHAWVWSWIIFILAIAIHQIMRLFNLLKEVR